MTRKQYVRRMRELSIKIKKNAGDKCYNTMKVGVPNWGSEIMIGSHKGEKLVSYKQCYDMIYESLSNVYDMRK